MDILLLTKDRDENHTKCWLSLGNIYRYIPEDKTKIQVLVADFSHDVNPELIREFPNLKIVASPTTGHTHLKFDPDECKVKLLTLKGHPELKTVRSVAELTFKYMLDLSRPKSGIGHTLAGKTLGIVGLGRIGKQVLDLCYHFKMRPRFFDKGSHVEMLSMLFIESDFISIHLEENPQTIGMINDGLIGLMKPTAFLLNTSRPSIVDNKALIDAVLNNKIAGCAMDFHPNFPVPVMDNIILTSHIGGHTVEDREKTDLMLIEMIKNQLQERSTTQ